MCAANFRNCQPLSVSLFVCFFIEDTEDRSPYTGQQHCFRYHMRFTAFNKVEKQKNSHHQNRLNICILKCRANLHLLSYKHEVTVNKVKC